MSTLLLQDTLHAFGFKTYFVRVSSTKEMAVKGAKVTTLSSTKTFPKHIEEDIPIENDVSNAPCMQTRIIEMYVYKF